MSQETIDCTLLGCDSELLPVEFDPCATQYAYNQIGTIYVANVGFPLTDWTDPVEWASRINDTSTDADAIREIPLIGTLEIEEGEQIIVPLNGFAYGKQTFNFTGNIYDNNNTNYTWIRSTGCNKPYLFWFKTVDGLHLYGSNSGVLSTGVILKGREPITDDRESFRTFEVVASWQAQLAALRISSPI
jgi:hypothetical protein